MSNEDLPLCPHCNGSGEGQYDGTTCSYCKGGGVERGKPAEFNDPPDYREEEYEYN